MFKSLIGTHTLLRNLSENFNRKEKLEKPKVQKACLPYKQAFKREETP